MTKWQLACLDMAGTTVRDDGLVDQAFTVAVAGQGVAPGTVEYERMRAVVRKTQGQSKIEVFRLLLGGDERRARAANETFEEAYGLLVDDGAVTPIPGAAEAIRALRAAGVKVALMTGFARATQDAIIDAIGWRGLIDLSLSPAEAGRGRPYPDLVLVAALRLAVDDMRQVAVVGDTPPAGATHVVGSVGELPFLLGVERRLAV